MPSERNYCPCLEQFFIKFLSKAHFPGLMVQTSGNKYFSGNADTALTAEKWLVPQHCPAWIQPLCISLDIPASIPYMDWESSPHHVGNISTPESTWCIAKSWADQPSLCWRREISQSKAVWQPLLWDCFSVSHLCVGYCTEFLCKGQEALFYYKPFETRTWNILDLVMDRHFLHGNLKRCQSNRVKDSMNKRNLTLQHLAILTWYFSDLIFFHQWGLNFFHTYHIEDNPWPTKTSCLPEADILLEEIPLVSAPCQGRFCRIWTAVVSMYLPRH